MTPFKLKKYFAESPHPQFLWIIFLFTSGLLLFSLIFRVGKYNYFQYPISYSQDGIEFLKVIKNIIQFNHFNSNSHLGFPSGSNLYVDFPAADIGSIVIIKLLTLIIGSNIFLIENIYILLSIELIAICTFIFTETFKFNHFVRYWLSLLYAFTPYLFFRISVGHLYLIQYFSIPIIFYLINKLFIQDIAKPIFNLKILMLLIFIGLFGSGYYAYFGCLTFFLAGIIKSIQKSSWRYLLIAMFCIATISLTVLIEISPYLVNQIKSGWNQIAARNINQISEFGLQLSRVIFPGPNSKIPLFNHLSTQIFPQSIQHEQYQYLGLGGLIGFIILLLVLVKPNANPLLRSLGLILTGLIFIGVAGGLNLAIASIITPQIRVYGRLTIFITYLGLIALGYLLQSLISRKPVFKKYLTGLLLIIFIEQISYFNPHQNYWKNKDKFNNDAKIIYQIELNFPNSKIYQLPHMTYPESGDECSLESYGHLIGYLHSKNLDWSFGAVKGREGDSWNRALNKLPPLLMLSETKKAGFSLIYFDSFGCLNRSDWLDFLSANLGGAKLISDDNRIFIFDLSNYEKFNESKSLISDRPVVEYSAEWGSPKLKNNSYYYENKQKLLIKVAGPVSEVEISMKINKFTNSSTELIVQMDSDRIVKTLNSESLDLVHIFNVQNSKENAIIEISSTNPITIINPQISFK